MSDELRLEQLSQHGWVRISDVTPADLCLLLAKFGMVKAPEMLTAMDSPVGRPRTLSGVHGLSSFPFHTDGAAERIPPSFVGLWSPRAYETATLVADGESSLLADPLFGRCWVVSPGGHRAPFYAIPRVVRRARVTWRLNSDCMSPTGSMVPSSAVHDVLSAAQSSRIKWGASDALILDNRRVLHSREPLSPRDANRELLRIRVYDGLVA